MSAITVPIAVVEIAQLTPCNILSHIKAVIPFTQLYIYIAKVKRNSPSIINDRLPNLSRSPPITGRKITADNIKIPIERPTWVSLPPMCFINSGRVGCSI
jgi:hypothetical protein